MEGVAWTGVIRNSEPSRPHRRGGSIKPSINQAFNQPGGLHPNLPPPASSACRTWKPIERKVRNNQTPGAGATGTSTHQPRQRRNYRTNSCSVGGPPTSVASPAIRRLSALLGEGSRSSAGGVTGSCSARRTRAGSVPAVPDSAPHRFGFTRTRHTPYERVSPRVLHGKLRRPPVERPRKLAGHAVQDLGGHPV